MSYSAQHYAVKRRARRAHRRRLGIPGHNDLLAIYIRWARQRYYLFHEGTVQQDAPSSAVSTCSSQDALDALDALDEFHEQDSGAPLANLSFDAQMLSTDLLGMGAGFEGDDDALVPGYPSELELIG